VVYRTVLHYSTVQYSVYQYSTVLFVLRVYCESQPVALCGTGRVLLLSIRHQLGQRHVRRQWYTTIFAPDMLLLTTLLIVIAEYWVHGPWGGAALPHAH